MVVWKLERLLTLERTGDVISELLHDPPCRGLHESDSDDATKEPEPDVLRNLLSSTGSEMSAFIAAAAGKPWSLPRGRAVSPLVLANALPIPDVPQIPPPFHAEPPLPRFWPSDELCEERESSPVFLLGADGNPPKLDRPCFSRNVVSARL